MDWDVIISIVLLTAGGSVGFFARKYVGSYASEKGSNLATKEDVRHITEEIEKVKSEIQTLGQLKTDYEQQRRDWLLTFYDTVVQILYDRFAVNFGDFPFDGGQSLFQYQKDFRASVSTLAKAYQRIVVYFEHEDRVRVYAEEVLNAVLDARKVISRRFAAVKSSFVEEELAFNSGDRERMGAAVEESNRANKAFWDEMHPVAETFQIALRSYLASVNQFLRSGAQ